MTDILIKNVPTQVHKRFKRLCLDRDITMNAALIKLIRKAGRK